MPAQTTKTQKSSKEETVKKREEKPSAIQEALTAEQVSPAAIFQRASADPRTLTPGNVLQLQRTIGNQAVHQLLARTAAHELPQEKENNTGLPDDLKDGIEDLSGIALDHVKVHYNSSKPSEVQALAYTQGTDIYVAPGQEKHLPHEAWHVAQQAQGRVSPTMQLKGVQISDEEGLEEEADEIGKLVVSRKKDDAAISTLQAATDNSSRQIAQARFLSQYLQTTASALQRKPWDNEPAKFRTAHGITGIEIPESEYLILSHSYKRFAPINEIRAPGQIFHEGPRSFAYLNSEGDAAIASKAVEATCESDTITLTTGSGRAVRASRVPANGKSVWDADVSDDDKVGRRHVGHKVKDLGQPLPTLEDPQKIQEARYKQHAVKKNQESGKIRSDKSSQALLDAFEDAFHGDNESALKAMMHQPHIVNPIKKAQKEGKTKLEIVEDLASMYGWSESTVTKMVKDEELDERASTRIEREHEPTPSYIS